MVRDWVAGKCGSDDVLALADKLQSDFTLEESAQLQAEAFRIAAGTDIGLVSLGGYHDGVENPSGFCGMLFKGDITEMVVNAIPRSIWRTCLRSDTYRRGYQDAAGNGI